ncbi:integrase [Kitasatospora sp. NPDC059327]|uniref:integrase n=1 Tax=Kitasatospora sp. NPDC059327 TaxID=3346803 RepID=UPI00367FC792
MLQFLGVDDADIRRSFAQLPPAVPLPTANALLSLSRTTGYKLARTGQYPCTVLRLGVEYRVRKNELQRLLHLSDAPSEQAVA